VSGARNAGVRLLDTDIVAVLDGDDAWEPDWTVAVGARFVDPEVVAASSWLRTFGVADWVLRPLGGDVTAFLARNNCSFSVAFRRSRWLACGGYDETMTAGFDDWDFALRLLGAGGRLDVLPRALIRYRMFKPYRGEHVQRGVPPAAVVDPFDPVGDAEHRAGFGGPDVPVVELDLQAGPVGL
jgi:GT2 family glycosyltransferase